MQLFQKKNIEDGLTSRIEEFERVVAVLKCFRPIQVLNLTAAIGQYKNALNIVTKSGLDTASEYYKRKPFFLHEIVWRDIHEILENGSGLVASIYDLPDFLAREQKTKDEKRALYNARMSEERRTAKLKTKSALEEQARKRQEFELATGVKLD